MYSLPLGLWQLAWVGVHGLQEFPTLEILQPKP